MKNKQYQPVTAVWEVTMGCNCVASTAVPPAKQVDVTLYPAAYIDY
ncbi:Uncharacterised protein [Bacteroides thetaiotaomicron]|jgi:hypothetical protein|uniref:Uncharacterized protein n=1 Tax=Bacteroides thetaiotaomicron TaxID=818 RepID=A0A174UUK9_BACT4|nr:Uncharacterised protein [Bacteroides thetaiotaomicron]